MTTRNTRFQLKNANNPNQAYPASLLLGEPIVNTADGIMLFSGNTTSTSGWTQSPSGATFFEVGSNLYNLKIRNQITSYSGITNLSGKFLSGTSNGFVLANISDITSTGSTSSPFTGGTVSGATIFTGGLSANTISATTYVNLPTDIRTTGGTYSNNTFTFTNNTGGTYSVLFNTVTGLTVNGGLTVTGNTSLRGLTATTISATTYQNLPRDVFVSGGTYNSGSTSLTFTNTTGGTFNVTGVRGTYVESGIFYPFSGRGTSQYYYNTGGGFDVTGYTYGISTADGIENTPLYLSSGATLGTKIQDIQVQSDGKILIGGNPPYLTRLNPDGTKDTIFETNLGSNFNDTVRSVRIQSDGKIIVGGEFTTFNGNSIPYFIRLNSDGTEDTSFTSNLGTNFNDTVRSVRIQSDGKIIVGGEFKEFNTNSVGCFTRLNSDGSLDSTFNSTLSSSFNDIVYAIELQPDGKILVGGNFTSFNGNSIPRLTRLNPDGTEDTSFTSNLGTSFDSQVLVIRIQPDGKILVGGNFTSFNTLSRHGLVRLFSDGTEDAPFYTNSDGFNVVYDIQVQLDGKILVGGEFTSSGRNRIGRVLDTGVNDTIFNNNIGLGPNGSVYVINIQTNGLIIVGGEFTIFNSIDRTNINYLYNFTQFSYDNPVGNDGSNSGRWRFITGSTSPSNPIGGNFITDDTDLSAILDISTSIYGINGANYYSWWSELKTAVDSSYVTHLQITELGNNSVVGIYRIFGITDNTTYFDIHINNIVVSNGYLENNKEYTLSWIYGVTGTGGTVSGDYLPLSGGTVTGGTIFQSGVTANTISATTYYNLPTDVFVTGGTYTSGNVIFTNNTGGTFTVTGFAIGGGGGEIFYLNLSQSQNGNRLLSTTASTASEQTSGVTIGNGVTGSIASFQTTPLNISLIPGGIWSFYLHSYKQNSNASFNIFVEVYKITSGGGQTLLFATDPTSVTTDSPNPSMQLTDGYFSGTPLSISDSIVAVVRSTNTGSQSHTITLITEGSQHYSYAVSTIPTQQGLTCDTLSGCSIIQTIQTDISNKFDKSGGTVSGATIFTGGLSANTISTTTISATTINSGSTNLSNLFLNQDSLIAGTNIKLSATSNSVTINSSYPHTGFLTVNNGAKRYYHNTINFVSSMGVAAPGTNTLRLYPFINNRTITLNEIAVNCTTSGASGVVALALYDSLPNSELRPNNLLQVFGSASTTTTGVKSITGSTITLQPGLYWFGINNNSTAQFSSPASGCISLGSNISMSTQVASMSSAVTFSMSFPASMSAATTYAQATLLFAYHPLTVS